jgi:hypothetical protein
MKARHYLLIPALAAMAVSCSSEADVLQPEPRTTVRATTEYTPATRTIFGTPTSADEGLTYTIPLTWNEDPTSEHIDVAGFDTDGKAISFTNFVTYFLGVAGSLTNGDQSIKFTGTPPANEGTVAYFYPYDAFVDNSSGKIENRIGLTYSQNQWGGNDNREHLSSFNWMYSDAVDEGEDFTLHQLGAIVRFDLTFPYAVKDGDIMLSSNKNSFISSVEISYTSGTTPVITPTGSDSQGIEIDGISPAEKHVIVYMMVGAVPAASGFTGLNSANLTLEATMGIEGGGSALYTKMLTTHGTATWEPGKTYNIVVGENDWD